jgi:hypothetical protein
VDYLTLQAARFVTDSLPWFDIPPPEGLGRGWCGGSAPMSWHIFRVHWLMIDQLDLT